METTPAEAQQNLQSAMTDFRRDISSGLGALTRPMLQQAHDAAVDTLRSADGPQATALAETIRDAEALLNRTSPEEAAAALPTRRSARRQPTRSERLRQQATGFVAQAAAAAIEARNPPGPGLKTLGAREVGRSFAATLVGDMSNGRLRSLGRMSGAEVHQAALDAGLTSNEATVAMNEINRIVSNRYETAIQNRAERALNQTADQLNRAANPASTEFQNLEQAILNGEAGDILRNLKLLDCNSTQINLLLSNPTSERVRQWLPGLLRVAASELRDQAEEVASWDPEEALASRRFPQFANDLTREWSRNGVIGSAVNHNISRARQTEHERNVAWEVLSFGVAIVASIATCGATALVFAAGREAYFAHEAFEEAGTAAAASMVGGTTLHEAERAETQAYVRMATGVATVGLEFATGRATHHVIEGIVNRRAAAEVTEEVAEAIVEEIVEEAAEHGAGVLLQTGAGAVEGTVGVGIGHARNAADEALTGAFSSHN